MPQMVVIGSNSFTGSHIVDALLDDSNNEVIGISRSAEYPDLFLPYKKRNSSQFRFHQMDMVRDFDEVVQLLDRVKPQVVINVAAFSEVALSYDRPAEYFEINTLAVARLCDYLRRLSHLERYVHISSAEIFGTCAEPVTEEAPFRPSTPYAVSKAAADMLVTTLLENLDFPATTIRSTNVYGMHQQLWKIIPRVAIRLKTGNTIELHGGGTAIKSFVHITDVVRGLQLALEHGELGTYHFTVASEETVADVVRVVCEQMGFEFEDVTLMVGERLGQDARYWLDPSKASRELGWAPQVPFAEGVKEVVEWVEHNWDAVGREPWEYVHVRPAS